MKKQIAKLAIVAGIAVFSASSFAETYAVCMGVNEYAVPLDSKGNPIKDEKGNPISNNLQGAVNDAQTMHDLFVNKFKVKSENVRIATDKDANVDGFVKQMKWLIDTAKEGDQVLFSFSGHGSQIPDKSKESGKSSVIVLSDLQCIPGDFFKKFSTALKKSGVNSTFIFDSCFSGGMSRNPVMFNGSQLKAVRARFLSPYAAGAHANGTLSAKPALQSETNLLAITGASKSKPRSMAKKNEIKGETAFLFASSEQQTSSDLQFKDPAKKSHGLFTLLLDLVVSENPLVPVGDTVAAINKFITEKTQFAQRPGSEFGNEERSKRPLIFDN